MPQNVITKNIALKPQPEAIAQESQAVESYADRLMDELFEDVDRVLDETSTLPTQPVQPEILSLKPISVPHIVLPPTMLPGRGDKTDEAAIARQVALAAKKLESNRTFDRILLGAAFASLVITLGLWLASRGGLGRETTRQTSSTDSAATQAKLQADSQFADYLQQAIDTTDQKKVAQGKSQSPNALAVPPVPPIMPTIAIPGGPPPNAGIAQAINRVADALEQQGAKPAPAFGPATQVVILPPTASRNGSPARPSSAVAKAPGSTASPTAPGSTASPTAPASTASPTTRTSASPTTAPVSPTASPVAPIPATPAELPPREVAPPAATEPATASPTSAAAASSDAPSSTHTLVGVLELGDRSAALFEIDGVARRIYVGESIGASGWTLAEVKNQEAVIRKSGEVRSIFVGQKF